MFSKISNITILPNEPLKNHCTLRIGGNAKYFIKAHDIDVLLDILHVCNKHCLPYKIIGNGSNLLFDDAGFDGAIIQYTNNFKQIKNEKLYASSGCYMSELISYSTQHNLGGLEFCIGVPAQLGGAIVNNLGAYNNEIGAYIDHVTILHNNQIKYLSQADCEFTYHSSILKDIQLFNDKNSKINLSKHKNSLKQNLQPIVLSAILNLPHQDKQISQEKMKNYLSKRTLSQPLNFANAGSIFKRENDIIPSQLIDNAGLKGLRIGDVQVSTKHAGFIINLGNASSKDMLTLIEIIKNKIYEKYNVILNLEIEYINFKN